MVNTTPGGKPIGLALQFKKVFNETCSPSSTHGRTWIPKTVTTRARASNEVRGAISVDDFINGGGVSSAVMSAKARLSSMGKLANLEGSSYAKDDPSVQPSKEGRDGVGSIELTCLRCVGRGETDPRKKSYSVLRIKEMKKTKFATENNGRLFLKCHICRAAGSAVQHTHWESNREGCMR